MVVKRTAATITRSARMRMTPVARAALHFMHMMSIIASIFLVVTAKMIIATVVGAAIIALAGAIVILVIA